MSGGTNSAARVNKTTQSCRGSCWFARGTSRGPASTNLLHVVKRFQRAVCATSVENHGKANVWYDRLHIAADAASLIYWWEKWKRTTSGVSDGYVHERQQHSVYASKNAQPRHRSHRAT